jgi:hypothetical protein
LHPQNHEPGGLIFTGSLGYLGAGGYNILMWMIGQKLLVCLKTVRIKV